MNRRQFLASSLLSFFAVRQAFAMGAASQVGFARLDRGEDPRPQAIEQLMWEVKKRTSIDARESPVLVQAKSSEIFRHPLILWTATHATEPLTDDEIRNLQRYFQAGGLLFVDDASLPGENAFDSFIRAEITKLFPDDPLTRISNDHTIYRSFYLLERPYGRIDRQGFLEGVRQGPRTPLLYNRNDLFGAFGRDLLGQWMLPVTGGDHQRELAFRLGINLLMYATCTDYKRDQVHALPILRRRRWRVEPYEN